MDAMYVNECGMLTAIDRTIKFRSLVPMNTKEAARRVLPYTRSDSLALQSSRIRDKDVTLRWRMLRYDGTGQDDLDVKMNFTNAQDHVPEAEQNNRTIKERIRAAYHRLPYKAIPRIMINYLAMVQANQLNLFPAKGGVSKYYSVHKSCTLGFRGTGASYQFNIGHYVCRNVPLLHFCTSMLIIPEEQEYFHPHVAHQEQEYFHPHVTPVPQMTNSLERRAA
jgi:hypothetical protein